MIAFFGSSPFSVPFLDTLVQEGYVLNIVTQPDQPQGRGLRLGPNALKTRALAHHLRIYEGAADGTLIQWWKDHALTPQCAVVASFGKIIPRALLDALPCGMLNIHPSLLPRHRGASPVQWTILDGDSVTGVTIILMDTQVDHGPIIAQERSDVLPGDTTPILKERLALLGCAMLARTLPQWLNGQRSLVPQDHSAATFTKTLTREHGHLDWRKDAQRLARQMRAFLPWPGSWSIWNRNGRPIMLKWQDGYVSQYESDAPKGTVLPSTTKSIDVACAGRSVLSIRSVQMGGRRATDAASFLNGHRDMLGSVLI